MGKRLKTINVWFNDDEYERLTRLKKRVSWHDFIMQLVEKEKKKVG